MRGDRLGWCVREIRSEADLVIRNVRRDGGGGRAGSGSAGGFAWAAHFIEGRRAIVAADGSVEIDAVGHRE